MRYDNLYEKYDHTIRIGCWGCFIYVVLFFTAGGIILFFDLPIILSVPVLALFVILWLIGFIRARKLDQKNRDNDLYQEK